MSKVAITDKRGGTFEIVITFTYGECTRLPFNELRRISADLKQIPNGGVKAVTAFNLRNPEEARSFVRTLDLFGEDGSFVHGSPADPRELCKALPEDGSAAAQAAPVSPAPAPHAPAAAPRPRPVAPAPAQPAPAPRPAVQEAEDLEMESDEADDLEMERSAAPAPAPATPGKEIAKTIAESLAANENRAETLKRTANLPEADVRAEMIRQLFGRYKDEAFVAASLRRRDWSDITREEVTRVVGS